VLELEQSNSQILDKLEEMHVRRTPNQIYHDLQLLTPVGRCFALSAGDTLYKPAAKLMIQHLLTQNTLYNQMLMMKLMFYVVKSQDDLVVFADFFKDLKEQEDIYGNKLETANDPVPKLA